MDSVSWRFMIRQSNILSNRYEININVENKVKLVPIIRNVWKLFHREMSAELYDNYTKATNFE